MYPREVLKKAKDGFSKTHPAFFWDSAFSGEQFNFHHRCHTPLKNSHFKWGIPTILKMVSPIIPIKKLQFSVVMLVFRVATPPICPPKFHRAGPSTWVRPAVSPGPPLALSPLRPKTLRDSVAKILSSWWFQPI